MYYSLVRAQKRTSALCLIEIKASNKCSSSAASSSYRVQRTYAICKYQHLHMDICGHEMIIMPGKM